MATSKVLMSVKFMHFARQMQGFLSENNDLLSDDEKDWLVHCHDVFGELAIERDNRERIVNL